MPRKLIKAPPGRGHVDSLIFTLSRELRDMIYEYTFSGSAAIHVDLTDETTFTAHKKTLNAAEDIGGLNHTCSIIRQECSHMVCKQPNLKIRIPLWHHPDWDQYLDATRQTIRSIAKKGEDFTLPPWNIEAPTKTKKRPTKKQSKKAPTLDSVFHRRWARVDVDLGMMDTTTFVDLYDGFYRADMHVINFFLNDLLGAPRTRIIAQARLRNDEVVHLILARETDRASGVVWPKAADGSEVRPTRATILKAALRLNHGLRQFRHDSNNTIHDIYIDPQY